MIINIESILLKVDETIKALRGDHKNALGSDWNFFLNKLLEFSKIIIKQP